MSDSGIKDVLALAEAISSKRATDEKFAAMFEKMAEMLNEASTALAEVSESVAGREPSKPVDIEALSKSLAAAFVVAIKNMPAPVVKVEAPMRTAEQSWSRIDIDLNRDASGRIGNKLTLTRT